MKIEKCESKFVTGQLHDLGQVTLVQDTCESSKVHSSKRSDEDSLNYQISESQVSEELISIHLSLLAPFCMRLKSGA